jgi:predicted phosphodiesterase
MRYVDLLKDKDTYGILLGDNFENAVPARGEGMIWDQSITPQEQLDETVDTYYPYRNKIIAGCGSNHSERSWKEVGLDMDQELFSRLGIPKRYAGPEGVVTFCGKKIAFAHGQGFGTNEWGDARKLYAIYPQADIIAVSHRHEMSLKWYGAFELDEKSASKEKFVLFARTGGLMQWARYARKAMYAPQKPGFTILNFHNDGSIDANTKGV